MFGRIKDWRSIAMRYSRFHNLIMGAVILSVIIIIGLRDYCTRPLEFLEFSKWPISSTGLHDFLKRSYRVACVRAADSDWGLRNQRFAPYLQLDQKKEDR